MKKLKYEITNHDLGMIITSKKDYTNKDIAKHDAENKIYEMCMNKYECFNAFQKITVKIIEA